MSDDIHKEPVLAREEAASRLFGWTWGEMGSLAGSFIIALQVTGSAILTIAVTLGVFWFLRHYKKKLPDRFFGNAIRYLMRRHDWYRASQRDTEWRPPVLPRQS